MRSGVVCSSRALARAVSLGVALCLLLAATAGAATQGNDANVARVGVFVVGDFPAGFQSTKDPQKTHADNIKLAKGVAGCGPYVTLQRTVDPLPQAKSPRYADDSRSVSNEVDVFPSERAASAALVQYGKSSITGCLENLLEKQARQDPAGKSLADVVVTLERQDIVGLGDDSVVYEGTVVLTGKDGSSAQVGVGSAAVRVGRAVNVATYTTQREPLTEILSPALDASVARLRAALAKGSS